MTLRPQLKPVVPDSLADEDCDFHVELSSQLDGVAMGKYVAALLERAPQGLSADEFYLALADLLATVARVQLQKALLNLVVQDQLTIYATSDGKLRFILPKDFKALAAPRTDTTVRRLSAKVEIETQELRPVKVPVAPKVELLSKGRPSEYDWNRGRELWDAGSTYAHIASVLGCTYQGVKSAARRLHWPRRTQKPTLITVARTVDEPSRPASEEPQEEPVATAAHRTGRLRNWVTCPSCGHLTGANPCQECRNLLPTSLAQAGFGDATTESEGL